MSSRWPQMHVGTADTPLPAPMPDPEDDRDDDEPAVTPPDVVALLGFDPAADAPPATHQKVAQAEASRRRHEAEFLAAWRAWWRRKLDAIDAPVLPDAIPDRFDLTPDERTDLAQTLHRTLRGPLYLLAFQALRRAAGFPVDASTTPTRSDDFRLETGSQTHLVQVAETYRSDLHTAFEALLSETQDNPDTAERARIITEGLKRWAARRAAWKGEQVAATEGTDALSQAAVDFAAQNPAVFLEYRWHAVMDADTCTVCASLDGQRLRASQGPFPPAHPNCRCTTHPISEEPVVATSDHQPIRIP